MKKLLGGLILTLLPAIVMAEDLPIVNGYGQQTGYKVRTNENHAASPAEMVQAAQGINAAENAPAQGLDDSVAAGIREGYRQAQEDRRQHELIEAIKSNQPAQQNNGTRWLGQDKE